MNFNWKEYINLAEELVEFSDEAKLRTAISRAYYGAFCLARNKKGLKSYKPQKGENIHWKVINEYKRSPDYNEKFVGNTLDKLRKNRNDADYDEDRTIDFRLAQRVLIKAKQVLDKLGIKL